jgi:hypothetical protein
MLNSTILQLRKDRLISSAFRPGSRRFEDLGGRLEERSSL